MKKVILSIVLISYLAVSTGIVVNFHYCMNRLASTELFATNSKDCEKCGMNIQKSHGCCHDEVKVVKMETDQKVTAALHFDWATSPIIAQVPSTFISTSFYNVIVENDFHEHSPPLLTEQDTYLQNGVFRI